MADASRCVRCRSLLCALVARVKLGRWVFVSSAGRWSVIAVSRPLVVSRSSLELKFRTEEVRRCLGEVPVRLPIHVLAGGSFFSCCCRVWGEATLAPD